MTKYKRGEINLIKFPYQELDQYKQRPAIVLAPHDIQPHYIGAIYLYITSSVPVTPTKLDCVLEEGIWQSAGLLEPSCIKVERVFTIHDSMVVRQLGKLDPRMTEEVIAKFKAQFPDKLST